MARSSSRRDFLRRSLQGGMALSAASVLPAAITSCTPAHAGTGHKPWPFKTGFSQEPLGYAYNALEPVIDAQTMDIHYNKHAGAYSKNLKDAAQAENVAADSSVEAVLASVSKYTTKMRNNAGGHYNHSLFWQSLKKDADSGPKGACEEAFGELFTSKEEGEEKFVKAAMGVFGSGWIWITVDKDKRLKLETTANQDNSNPDGSKNARIICRK